MSVIVNIADLRDRARRRLPKAVFEYIDGGSYDQITLQRNRADLDALVLNEHVMNDVSQLNTATTLLGDKASIPLVVAPTGMAGLAWPKGESETAKAAEAFGIPYCLSTFSIDSIEDVAAAITRPFWAQLYLMTDQRVNESVIHRADVAGCSALVMTLDVHVHSQRWADDRNGLVAPLHVTPSNTLDMLRRLPWIARMLRTRHATFATMAKEHPQAWNVVQLAEWINSHLDHSIDEGTIRWVRSRWPRKFALKGIMRVDDAKRAVDLGADAIIVSNHGGRQLDGAPSTISVLPDIARAVGDQLEVLWDSGLRTGFDIVKAMGRGARGCLSGRAWLYGLAYRGRKGVAKALDIINGELKDCMALSGVTDLHNLPEGLVTETPAP